MFVRSESAADFVCLHMKPVASIKKLLLVLLASQMASLAQTPAASAMFEVAAIKPSQSGSVGSHADMNSGRFTATNVSLKSLMEYQAYDIPASRIDGGPAWVDSKKFDVEAKVDEGEAGRLKTLPRDERGNEIHAMFQRLLADRFQLIVHWETRELPVYVLVVPSNGAKLQATKETTGATGTSSGGSRAARFLSAKGVTLPQLAATLTREARGDLGREVIDKTDLQGRYDLTLKWSSDTANVGDPGGEAGPSIFTAVQEQLGLKLTPAKAPIQVLVIDRADLPSEN
jgi:uncharacterized protein (TIGR03435 family)